jgi:hypothetical protein
MAMAVQRLRKDAQVTIGPWIDRGFYYDFDMKEPLVDKDLKAIKKEMAKIIKADLPFIREEVSAPGARARAGRAQAAHRQRAGGVQAGRHRCFSAAAACSPVPAAAGCRWRRCPQPAGPPGRAPHCRPLRSCRRRRRARASARPASRTSWRSWTPSWRATPPRPSPSTTSARRSTRSTGGTCAPGPTCPAPAPSTPTPSSWRTWRVRARGPLGAGAGCRRCRRRHHRLLPAAF